MISRRDSYSGTSQNRKWDTYLGTRPGEKEFIYLGGSMIACWWWTLCNHDGSLTARPFSPNLLKADIALPSRSTKFCPSGRPYPCRGFKGIEPFSTFTVFPPCKSILYPLFCNKPSLTSTLTLIAGQSLANVISTKTHLWQPKLRK